jgi:hypothetical protein
MLASGARLCEKLKLVRSKLKQGKTNESEN